MIMNRLYLRGGSIVTVCLYGSHSRAFFPGFDHRLEELLPLHGQDLGLIEAVLVGCPHPISRHVLPVCQGQPQGVVEGLFASLIEELLLAVIRPLLFNTLTGLRRALSTLKADHSHLPECF